MAVVPASAQPANPDTTSSAAIVQQTLRDLGVNPVATASTNPLLSLANVADMGAQALRAIGINPISQTDINDVLGTQSAAYLAQNALNLLGVNLVEQASNPYSETTVYGVNDIATMALQVLGVIASDETAQTADLNVAAEFVLSFHGVVAQMNFARWGSGNIPASVANLYAIGVAAELGPVFEKPADPQGYAGAIAGIKGMANSNQYAQQYANDHIQLVHRMLVGKNLASWLVTAIPDAVGEYYSTLAAQEMATAFGAEFNPAAYNGAMAGLRRFALSGTYGQALAVAKLTQVHEYLNARNLSGWDVAHIPNAAAEAYIAMAAFLLEPSLERAPDQPQLYTQAAFDAAVERVRAIVLSGAFATTIATQELLQIHDALVGAALVSWTLNVVPAAVADSYSTLLAQNLAPTFGRPSDEKISAAARQQIKQYQMIIASQSLAEAELRVLHAEWRTRSMIRWELLDIPREAEQAYVLGTAYRIGPQFPGSAFDQNDCDRAEQLLWRVVTMPTSGQRVVAEYF